MVLDRVNIHRRKLAELREIIENVGKSPGSINDTDFRRRMSEVNESVTDLLNDARDAVGGCMIYFVKIFLLSLAGFDLM